MYLSHDINHHVQYMQIDGETFKKIQGDVLQGSTVVLDVEEEGLDERTILSLDAATKIYSNGTVCFRSLDGKENCFEDAQPGQCEAENSIGSQLPSVNYRAKYKR